MSTEFTVEGVLPGNEIERLPAGTSLLISGPSMVGKRELAIRTLAAGNGNGDGMLLVTTKANAKIILRDFERIKPGFDRDRVGLIDCSGSDDREGIREVTTEFVGSPGDLTGISIGTAKLMKRFADRDVANVRHGLVSVSTLLQYLDVETVFKFLHIYTNRVEASGGLAIFTLDADSHGEQVVNTITGEFDGILALREADGGTVEYRIRGFGRAPTDWRPLE